MILMNAPQMTQQPVGLVGFFRHRSPVDFIGIYLSGSLHHLGGWSANKPPVMVRRGGLVRLVRMPKRTKPGLVRMLDRSQPTRLVGNQILIPRQAWPELWRAFPPVGWIRGRWEWAEYPTPHLILSQNIITPW